MRHFSSVVLSYVFGVCIALTWSHTFSREAAHSADRSSTTAQLSCDKSIAERFKPDEQTKVLLVKQYHKGDALPYGKMVLTQEFGRDPIPIEADVCLVKLLVGPGNPGPADAPSTSPGIGIEIWLPSKEAWNGRIHAVGGGGWAGSEELDLTKVSSFTVASDITPPAIVATREGAVASSTDTGHSAGPDMALGGSFTMLPDGTINKTLWKDFASRAIHEQVVKTKALTKAFYGSNAKYTYWTGGSTGGRQALKQAQRYPEDFDGIISAFPAINWTKFITADLYPQVVIQRDLGGKYMSPDQLNLVSNAAIHACDEVGGKHLGFIIDLKACRYDPTKDKSVLCAGNGGKNETKACVTPTQALAFNKIWYGMTSDGSVPDPAVDNGTGHNLDGKRRWFGMPRGTNLLTPAYDPPFGIAADVVAVNLQDPTIAPSYFHNATGNGQDKWKALSYQRLSQAYDAGDALQREFADINTDDPDLSVFKARGGKLIQYHGTYDQQIPYQGSVYYYQRVLEKMGGLDAVQSFFRFYIIPAMAHGPVNGASNPEANPPTTGLFTGQIYKLLTDWVEKGVAPQKVVLHSASDKPVSKSLPMCAYPQVVTYVSGDPYVASSYTCR